MTDLSETRKFSDASGNYTLKIENEEIDLECYLLGSPTGGTGTECFHTIGVAKRSNFLADIKIENIDELLPLLESYESEEWSEFHQIVIKNQTDSFVWHETNWDD